MRREIVSVGFLLCAVIIAIAASGASAELAMVQIEPGSFTMGAIAEPLPDTMLEAPGRIMSKRPAEGDYDETPAHKVTISYPFRISREEVTIEQFRKFRPEYRGNPAFAPYAAGVSWHD